MEVYIATGLKNWVQHNELMVALAVRGHRVTYDWTTHGAVRDKGVERIREVAGLEARGVADASLVVVLLPTGLESFGRGTHAELGMAIALGKRIVLWSDEPLIFGATKETCAFYHHPLVEQVYSVPAKMVSAVLATVDPDWGLP